MAIPLEVEEAPSPPGSGSKGSGSKLRSWRERLAMSDGRLRTTVLINIASILEKRVSVSGGGRGHRARRLQRPLHAVMPAITP